jgi:hypothetical protein
MKKVWWNGIEVTKDCFEFFYDAKNPDQSWVKVFVREKPKDDNPGSVPPVRIDPLTNKPMWKFLYGEVVSEPPVEELRKIIEQTGVKSNG